MKITDVKAVYPKYQHLAPSWRTHFWQIVVRVDTETGITGYGYGGGGVAGVAVVNGHLRDHLIGREIESVADIQATYDMLYMESLPYGRKGLGVMALSGIDLALYDMLGKARGVPVCALLSDEPKKNIRAYATGEDALRYRDLGYTANKFGHRWTGNDSDYDTAVRSAEHVREVFGDDALVMVDVYMSWDAEVTLEMSRRLADYDLYWFEDVLTPDDLDGQAALIDAVKPTLIAGGEHEFTRYGFDAIARAGAMDLWQPDITWCGGITEGMRIVEIAEQYGVPVAPHRGGEVWGLHLIAGSGCADLAEYHSDHIRDERDILWFNEPAPIDGYISPSDRPGFGVMLNEAIL